MDNPTLLLQRQRMLLEIEYNHEKEEFRKQTETMGVERKVRRGDAWFPVSIGRSYYNSLNQMVVEVMRQPGSDIEHNFEAGRPVCFFTIKNDMGTAGAKATKGGSKLQYLSFTATVSYAEQDRMVVALPDSGRIVDLQRQDALGVQLFFDETSYRLMFEALDRVIRARSGRLADLRDIFYTKVPASRYTFDAMRFPWLNASQEKAVNEVLWAKDVAVVHGPPGTGKTTTLVEAIFETLRRESQVLVCAQSNMAVDWISEKLVDRGINVLRIGNPTRVNDKMLSFTYERRFEAHPDYPQLWSIRKAIRELRQQRKHADSWHQKMDRLKSRATELELRIRSSLFGEARVIASTLTGAANRVLEGEKYSTLFIDEAAQALEAACWIAIRKAGRVILAGDHCQLPPTVKSIMALKGGLGKTLMERIVENKPETVTLLKMQYRMNEQIMKFSSEWFYHGMVESAPTVSHRGILDYDTPMMWIDTAECDGKEEFVGENFGRINRAEAELTLQTLQQYLEKIGKQRILEESIDVGIISPYRAQVQLLRKELRKREFFRPYRHLLTVNTVDGFQGQERDIILISLVRSNDGGDIGFLRDLRRMNVAITRARMKLIILGSSETMTSHPFYKKLYEYVGQLKVES
ncbi:AAA domain-containing protein [Prevotella sp. 885]|uniref:AAA domain-containing protein n=1 Tax=Prevotella sp. 885 TaxID=2022527 RepID=UPI000BA025DC|nr:AAA domain-containing protein [Prevotella sp. 885]OZT02948.1 helicase [Prevotella sp. 885]